MTPARERAEHLHAIALLESLQPITTRPTEAMLWLQNAGRVMDANREQWAAEDAENERLDAAEYEQWLDEQEQGQ